MAGFDRHDAPHRRISPARVVVPALALVILAALILGIATGDVNDSILRKPPITSSITVP